LCRCRTRKCKHLNIAQSALDASTLGDEVMTCVKDVGRKLKTNVVVPQDIGGPTGDLRNVGSAYKPARQNSRSDRRVITGTMNRHRAALRLIEARSAAVDFKHLTT
jgi:hypothetical protein